MYSYEILVHINLTIFLYFEFHLWLISSLVFNTIYLDKDLLLLVCTWLTMSLDVLMWYITCWCHHIHIKLSVVLFSVVTYLMYSSVVAILVYCTSSVPVQNNINLIEPTCALLFSSMMSIILSQVFFSLIVTSLNVIVFNCLFIGNFIHFY